MRLIRNWKPYKQLDCFFWKLQCVRIWTQTLQRLRCWFKNFQNVWDFEKKLNSQNHHMNHVTPRKRRLLHFPCVFGKHSFGAKNLKGIRNWTKILQRLGYWIGKLKTCKFWKTVWIHKVIVWIKLLRHNEGFRIFLAFPESIVSNWEF